MKKIEKLEKVRKIVLKFDQFHPFTEYLLHQKDNQIANKFLVLTHTSLKLFK